MSELTYFETIKCEEEEIFNLDYHNQRIARTIGLNLNLQEYIYPPNNQLLKCKVIYNQYEIINIDYSIYEVRDIKTFKIIYDDEIEYKYKSTQRKSIDNLYKRKEKADDIIIIKNGLVTDTSIANIAIYQNGTWITPSKPLLLGTTMSRLINENKIKIKNITPKELQNCSKIALLNAMIGFKIIENFIII